MVLELATHSGSMSRTSCERSTAASRMIGAQELAQSADDLRRAHALRDDVVQDLAELLARRVAGGNHVLPDLGIGHDRRQRLLHLVREACRQFSCKGQAGDVLELRAQRRGLFVGAATFLQACTRS